MDRGHWYTITAVLLGGGTGSAVRYLALELPISSHVATMIVNLLASFLLGMLSATKSRFNQPLFVGMGVGFCGGLSTMSTFAYDIVQIFHESVAFLTIYMIVSIIGGITLAFIGYAIGKRINRGDDH
ncbi:CrcB family protein [Geomicrobium sp. JCM 19038]|uniref:fluoride efflux transporter FluC n=1 Tax=Geomicrobium sp. JCM 19038 TaxID=1460635 RepID=UPI00045F1784|nr:CrcB family protein [Geomicrobium sp. JCM 19038]GAK07268.1 CrcB protein [Geomicrobium sp. JCM 19038]